MSYTVKIVSSPPKAPEEDDHAVARDRLDLVGDELLAVIGFTVEAECGKLADLTGRVVDLDDADIGGKALLIAQLAAKRISGIAA